MYVKKKNIKFDFKLFLKDLFNHIKKDNITMLTSQTTYNLIVALVPFLVIAINVILYFASSQMNVIESYINTFPKDIADIGISVLRFILSQRSTGILSVGILIALWTSSRGMKALIKSLNMAFDKEGTTTFLATQVKAIIFTVILVLIIVVLLLGLVFGDIIINTIIDFFKIEIEIVYKIIFNFSRIIVPFILMVISFSFMYMFGPTFSFSDLPPFIPCLIGGFIATVSVIIVTLAYTFYINNFSKMSSIYGPLVGVMILFIWMYYMVMSIILAGEISAAIIRYNYDIDYDKLENNSLSVIDSIKEFKKNIFK
ncbi:MAG: YihY/virulence factor BrkB family protein [Miniphocaeibacter sp.]|uniref:YihY/virulence factor BrkB family protein n=1 Tax=Miniphocaeibacter sp. TaxID=3100973 RepID=UPI0017A0082A|nr:YihY/virulence factor BrkB family protein [Gallicola sp.]